MERLWKVLPLALAVAALVVVLLQRSTINDMEARLAARSKEGPAQRAAEPAPADRSDLERRIASLEQTVARVFRMVIADSSRAAGRKGAPSSDAPPSTVSDLREDVDALLTGEAVSTEQGRKRLHDIVRKVQEDAREDRRQRWRTMRDEMRRSRLKTLAKKTGMSANQVERLNTLMDDERTQRRALMLAARDGQRPFPEAMEQIRALRQGTDTKAKEMLDSKQYEAYENMRQERRGRHR